jgi:hypothetical protein
LSATLWTALCLQGAAVVLLRRRLGRSWLQRPVTILVLTAVLYDGVVELLLAIPSIRVWDTNRLGISQENIDSAALITSVGLLVLTLCYLATRPECASRRPDGSEAAMAAAVLDWRIFAICCIPLYVLTYEGRGYDSDVAAGTATAQLSSEFLVLLVVLAAFSFLLRHGIRWFVPTLIVQSILLATAGERSPLLTDAIVLIILLAQVRMRPSSRQTGATVALTVLVILAVTGYRAEAGYGLFSQGSGVRARLGALDNGFSSLLRTSNSLGTRPGLVAQAAARLDGNAFAGEVLQGMHAGVKTLGPVDVAESLLVVVPSAAWPSKLSHSAGLNPTVTEIRQFDLQPVAGVAIAPLPTFLGLYLGFLGQYWLTVFLACCGLIFGWAERWLLRTFTVPRLVALGAAVQAAFAYEAGLPTMLVGLRTALVLALAVRLMQAVRAAPSSVRASAGDPGEVAAVTMPARNRRSRPGPALGSGRWSPR